MLRAALLMEEIAPQRGSLLVSLAMFAAIMGVLLFSSQWVARHGAHLGWRFGFAGLYGLLIPGISYLHVRRLEQGASGFAAIGEVELASLGRWVAAGALEGTPWWEVAFGNGEDPQLLGAVIDGTKPARSGTMFVLMWFWKGDLARELAKTGTPITLRRDPRATPWSTKANTIVCAGSVVDVSPYKDWRQARRGFKGSEAT